MEKWNKESGKWEEFSGSDLEGTAYEDSDRLFKIGVVEAEGEVTILKWYIQDGGLDLGEILSDSVLLYSIKECFNSSYGDVFETVHEFTTFLESNLGCFTFSQKGKKTVVTFMNEQILKYDPVDNK